MIRKFCVRLFCLVALAIGSPAFAQFTSMHAFPLTYVKSTGLDAQGNFIATYTEQLTGFKNQFAPTGTSGCVIGYPEYRSECATVQGGFGFIQTGYTSYREFKVYVPAGTTFFGLSGYMPQSVQYAVTVRMGQTPVRTAALSESEYQTAKSAQNINTAFGRLQAGEELLMVHDGGGNISLSGTARLSATPVATGSWLYVRVLNGDSIYNLTGVYEVNRTQYKQAYSTMAFGADGDPDSGGTPPTTGGGTTTPPVTGTTTLTGIVLSQTEWTVGAASSTFTITPVPSTASLPTCTYSPSALLSNSQFANSSLATVVINTAAASQLATAITNVTITCGTQTATFRINQLGATTSVATVVDTAADGKVTLKVKLTRPLADVTAGAAASYWVGAVIPVGGYFYQGDEWFFLTQNAGATATEWKQLTLPSPDLVAYSKNRPVTSITEDFSIPMGFTKAEFAAFKIQIHFGYQLNGGTFRSLGKIWDPAAVN